MRASLVVALLACCSAVGAAPLSEWLEGTAKSWGGPQDGKDPNSPSGGLLSGSCGYGELMRNEWPFWSVAAVSPDSFLTASASRLPKAGCGACLQMQCVDRPGFEGRCPVGTESAVTVQVVDTCTDCDAHKMAIHYLAFNQKLADPGFGEVAIRYRQVECNPSGANVTLDIDIYRASEGGYIRLALEGLAGSGALQAVELRKSVAMSDLLSTATSSWRPLANTYGARWEVSGLPQPPIDLRITGADGETLVVRQAIKVAGETGRFTTPVQFSTHELSGTADGVMAANAKLRTPAQCNDTLYNFLQSHPELSTLLQHINKAGAAKLLQDPTTSATLFAPTNAAWSRVPSEVDLSDMEALQNVLLFLVAPGQVVMPDTSAMLPEDMERGGVRVTVDTLQGARLEVLAGPTEIRIADGSHLTSDAIVVDSNEIVCSSVVNIISEVPMPFS